ncbi:MAG: PKD domain-containing protein [Pseudomonadota bacterium]
MIEPRSVSVSQTNSTNQAVFQRAHTGQSQTPVELYSPYQFQPGAKLYRRSGLDVDAPSTDLLTDYFGSSAYDVKDLNVSADGKRFVFAAHGPLSHPTDYTWNLYEYDLETQRLRRIIEDHALANAGHDSSPAYTLDGHIVFSSDRSSGNPASPVVNTLPDEEYCYLVENDDRPSLLHSMSTNGENIVQLTYGNHHDTNTTTMKDGQIAFVRWSYTYSIVDNCEAPASSRSASIDLLKAAAASPFGMARPESWSHQQACEYSEGSPIGQISVNNHYRLLRIDHQSLAIDQLYKTVTLNSSEEQFIFLDRIVQAEDGHLVGIIKHKFADSLGGNLLRFNNPSQTSDNRVFGNLAPQSLVEGEVALYPDQLSARGWYSAVWPYRDGSSRLLVSWSQCLTENNGVNRFCENRAANGDGLASQYGIWVLDERNNSRLPILRAKPDTVYNHVAMARPHLGLEFPYTPYNDNFVDNPDNTQLVCNYPDPVNRAPLANAGADQTVVPGPVTLDGSASSDPDSDAITYLWSIISAPAGEIPSLSDATSARPSFEVSQAGSYQYSLIVNDGELDSAPDLVSIVVSESAVNKAPIANAGQDRTGLVGVSLSLDGTASRDPDGDPLRYQWSVITPGGIEPSVFSGAATANPDITLNTPGTYVVQLVVNDGQLDSSPDTLSIVINKPNRAPIADAGTNQQLALGSNVQLNGSGSSDPDGDALNYQWTLVSSPKPLSLANANTVTPGLTVNDFGTYVIQLVVNDGQLSSAADTVSLQVSNKRPVADAGANRSSVINQSTDFDGSQSYDPDGSDITYRWTLSAFPAGSRASLAGATSANPSITADVEGDYVLSLTVNDGSLDSRPDTVTLTASNTPNTPPLADAGSDQPVSVGNTVTLDGSGSSDADGDALAYQWTVISPAGVSLNNAETVAPSLTISESATYTIQLVVNDGTVDSAPDTVLLQNNVKPVADAGDNQTLAVNSLLTLDGSGSTDADGDPLSYSWSLIAQPSDSSALLDSAQAVNPSFTVDVEGRYTVQLIVNDGKQDSDPDTLIISTSNSAPLADAGNDVSVSLGGSVDLDGSASYDPDGDDLRYQWTLSSAPTGSTATLINDSSATPSLQGVDVFGDYVVQLIVNDGNLDSRPDTVLASSNNLRPVANAGEDAVYNVGQELSLDGSGSFDPEGNALSYRWSLLSVPEGSGAVLSDSTKPAPRFTPDIAGHYVAQLIVNDGDLNSEPDTVTLQASAPVCTPVGDVNLRGLPVLIRDFTAAHPDFEAGIFTQDLGIVEQDLGPDGKPVYAHGGAGTATTNGVNAFNQWYNDVAGVNLPIPISLTMARTQGTNIWTYANNRFFPIDDDVIAPGVVTWGNSPEGQAEGLDHNFHFTLEANLEFYYQGGETFTFSGDDDLWVYINGKLAIDIGGVHSVLETTISLDDIADYLGIVPGNTYTFDLFFAERNTSQSNFSFQTSINLDCVQD